MNSFAWELEATSQLPPSTPQQRVTPSTVLLPATVALMTPLQPSMPHLAHFLTTNSAAVGAVPTMTSSSLSSLLPLQTPPQMQQQWSAPDPAMGWSDVAGSSSFADSCAVMPKMSTANRCSEPQRWNSGGDSSAGPDALSLSSPKEGMDCPTVLDVVTVGDGESGSDGATTTTAASSTAATASDGGRCKEPEPHRESYREWPLRGPLYQVPLFRQQQQQRLPRPPSILSGPSTPMVSATTPTSPQLHRRTYNFEGRVDASSAGYPLLSVSEAPSALTAISHAGSSGERGEPSANSQPSLACAPAVTLTESSKKAHPLWVGMQAATDPFCSISSTSPPSQQAVSNTAAVRHFHQSRGTSGSPSSSSTASLAVHRLAPSPFPSSTTTSPPLLLYLSDPLGSRGGVVYPYHSPSSSAASTSMSSATGTLAFVPIGVQPATTTTRTATSTSPPSSSSRCRSPSCATTGQFDSVGRPSAGSTLPTAPNCGLAALLPSPPASPARTTLEAPVPQDSGEPTATTLHLPATLQSLSATPPTTPSAPLGLYPCASTSSVTAILAAPEVSWHSQGTGVGIHPAGNAGTSTLPDGYYQSFIIGCHQGELMATPPPGTHPSTNSTSPSRALPQARPLSTTGATTSTASEPQCRNGGDATLWDTSATSMVSACRGVQAPGSEDLFSSGGSSGGRCSAVTASAGLVPAGVISFGGALYSNLPQLHCTPVPLDDTDSVCAICLEGQTRVPAIHRVSVFSPSHVPSSLSTRAGTARSANDTEDMEEKERRGAGGAEGQQRPTRGVKPGSCLLALPCGHRCHQNCVQRWIMESQSCPICRRDLTRDATFQGGKLMGTSASALPPPQ